MSNPQHSRRSETATVGEELVKYEPYLELVSRLWLAAANERSQHLTDKIARRTRLGRAQGLVVYEPMNSEEFKVRIAEHRRDYTEYLASLPVKEPAAVESEGQRFGSIARPGALQSPSATTTSSHPSTKGW